jgi:hypothetical protein
MTPPAPPRRAPGPVPSPRTPALLAVGHAALGVGTFALFFWLIIDQATHSTHEQRETQSSLFYTALICLAAGQVLAIRRLLEHRRALIRGHLDASTLSTGTRRIGWTVGLAYAPMVLGIQTLTQIPPSAPPLAVLCALVPASLLLDHAHAGWAYRFLDGNGPEVRLLPAGSAARVVNGQIGLVIGCLMLATVGLALVVRTFTQTTETSTAARVLGLLSATTVTLLPLLLIRPVLGVRRAIGPVVHGGIRYDTAHLPALDAASRSMRHLGPLGVLATALTAAAVAATPAAPLAAAGVAVPLVITLGILTLQLASNTCINVADPRVLNRHRGRRATSGF